MRLPSDHVQPLYVSSATTRKMEQSLGTMDYNREFEFYKMLDEAFAAAIPLHSSAKPCGRQPLE